MHTFTTILLLLPIIAIFQCITATRFSHQRCRIELGRFISSKPVYVLTCKCASFSEAKSFAFVNGPSPKLDTAGRSQATQRCIEWQLPKLVRLCDHLDSESFSKIATPILNRCVRNVILTRQQAQQTMPFTFDDSTCLSKIASVKNENNIEAAWVCECQQAGVFEVVRAWARFRLGGNTDLVQKELALVQTCALTKAGARQSAICRDDAKDYTILGLRTLYTCCKKVRAYSYRKYLCDAALIEGLSLSKLSIWHSLVWE